LTATRKQKQEIQNRNFKVKRHTTTPHIKIMFITNNKQIIATMLFSLAARKSAAFTPLSRVATRAYANTAINYAKEGQAEVILVGCGAPNRG
jgi:hypothetical protein